MVNSLLQRVVDDCNDFGRNLNTMPLNERHLQVLLYSYLQGRTGKDKYDNVFMEYSVPYEELFQGKRTKKDDRRNGTFETDFPWANDISIDIVVEKDGLFAAVELKYATHAVEQGNVKIFGEKPHGDFNIISTKAASDIIAYGFWKDVRRLEILTERYPKLAGGAAMMISNVKNMRNSHSAQTALNHVALTDNQQRYGAITWPDTFSKEVRKKCPTFSLKGSYMIKWQPTEISEKARDKDNTPFKFYLAIVDKGCLPTKKKK